MTSKKIKWIKMKNLFTSRSQLRKTKALLYFFLMVSLILAATPVKAQNSSNPEVVVLTAETSVTPVLATYIERGIKVAEGDNAELVVIALNTPGGSVDSMNEIVQQIRSSSVPVVVYVTPSNGMAASAGAIITLAGHISAMAPETTIGAASPVGSQGEDIGTTMEAKVKEILKASVRNLTINRKEEARKLAEEMIESARAVTVDEALEIGLIDIKATDLNDLLYQLNGRAVDVNGSSITLNTRGATIKTVANTFIEQVLDLLINPNLVFILLSIGIQAVLIELSSPGGWVAGFIGVVCILLAIYGIGILPVNWFGIIFMIVAFVLFIIDIKAPTHGALTVAGVVSFITGALVLFNTVRLPGVPPISVPLVIGTGIFIGVTFLVIIRVAIRAQHTPVKIGSETLPGKSGVVKTALTPNGNVQVGGELWGATLAEGETEILPGEEIEVVRLDGLRLVVRKKQKH
jgi:membrane-bound serine protease (ClpP class)